MMKHNSEFKQWLKKSLSEQLPGENAQYELAPLKRKEEEQLAKKHSASPRKSGVMLILYPENGEIFVPLIVRNIYHGVHSGQIAFPGGKYEEDDQTVMQTAIRETHEEININIAQDRILGQLSSLFVPVSNFIIYPFVAWVDVKPEFKPDENEVQKILEVPLSYLLDSSNRTSRQIPTAFGYSINAPVIPIEEHFLWGATAMMMSEFIALVRNFQH